MKRVCQIAVRRAAAAVALLMVAAPFATAQTVDSLRVMTYNIWGGGTESGLPISHTVGVIQVAQADVAGMQEQDENGAAIAALLGFHYHNLGGSTAILSRYPVVQSLPQGAKLQLSATQSAFIFNVHFAPFPYQPYDIQAGSITNEAQAIAAARATRGGSVSSLTERMASALASGSPVFLTGDFNEPSHLDWTAEAAAAGLNFGMKVDWPTSRAVTGAGLVDAFRELRPDEVNDRGETWTPGYPAPYVREGEVHDRIDFVYYSGMRVQATSAQEIGYDVNDGNTDIGIDPYPSDHRAVVVQFEIPECFLQGDLDGSCSLTANDWSLFRAGQHADLTGLSPNEAYLQGDLNRDFQNNHADFAMFKASFDAADGTGAFAAMLISVPEPSNAVLIAWLALSWIYLTQRRQGAKAEDSSNFAP